MLGDLCTKALFGPRVRELLNMMSVSCDERPSGADGGGVGIEIVECA